MTSDANRLYTPEMLSLAVELGKWPPNQVLALHGDARSPTCGSTIEIDIDADGQSRIDNLGMRVRACAVGQAAATIFAREAIGRNAVELEEVLDALKAWLAGDEPLPDWPGLAMIEPARTFPGRHGAILLPWQAALSALSSSASAR